MYIKGMDKARVLKGLYRFAKVQGMGFLHAHDEELTVEDFRRELDKGRTHWDYVQGRVMKVVVREGNDSIELGLYDRDNGAGSGERAILHEMEGG